MPKGTKTSLSHVFADILKGHGSKSIREIAQLSSLDNADVTRLIAFAMKSGKITHVVDLDRRSARMATARLAGVHADDDFTPTTAAAALGISRTHLRHLMDSGLIAFHMVGSHHRIKVAEVDRVRALWEHRGKGLAAMDAVSRDIDT